MPPARAGGPNHTQLAVRVRCSVADVDDGDIAHHVDLEDDHVAHLGGEQPLQRSMQLGTVGVGHVEGHQLTVGATTEPWMVDGVHDRHQHGRHGGGEPAGDRSETVDEPERESDEVVGNLLLGDLVRAQPDDRQDAEQAQTEPDAGLGTGEQDGDREHPEVQGDAGEQQVAAVVAAELDGVGQQHDRGQIARESGQQGHGR
jgi:hypothetical protein